MQSILQRLPWSAGNPKMDTVPAHKMRPLSYADAQLLNGAKRKATNSPEPICTSTQHEAKRRKLSVANRPLAHTTGKSHFDHQSQKAPPTMTAMDLSTCDGTSMSMPPSHTDSGRAQHTADINLPGTNMDATVSTVAPIPQSHNAVSTRTEPADAQSQPVFNILSHLSPLQQTIEHQFNLEILMKHRELQLIEQELAKCQVALEQLRRCEVIPFPGSFGLSEDVSTGRGPSLRHQSGFTQPKASAPWGTADGPYTRHYAKWLLPDATFDSVPISQVSTTHDAFAASQSDNRSTRNSGSGFNTASKRRSRDSIVSMPSQASNVNIGAPVPRNKGGPLVIKRLSDNQYVKLICNKCNRGNFSSVQGFLNHCRIAHKVDYKSHESAAQDCGHALEEHEQNLAATAPPPVGSTVRASVPKAPAPVAVTAHVHPLNQGVLPRPTWKRQRLAYSQSPSQLQTPTSLASSAKASPAVSSFHAAPFVPSVSTPSLSALFAKRGLGGNLESAISRARERLDLGSDEHGDDLDDDSSKVSPAATPASGARRTVGGNTSKAPPNSSVSTKGHRHPIHRPRPAPLSASSTRQFDAEVPESPQETEHSPHAADSNPGLVSDHDDDPASEPDEDAGSVIAPSHPISLSRNCGEADAMDLDLEVEEEHDGHGVIIQPKGIRERQMHGPGSPSRPRSRYGDGMK